MKYTIQLNPDMFSSKENKLFEGNGIQLRTFLYSTGVEAVRITVGRGEYVWLPFYAQQIWSWKIDGIEQKFEGFIEEPRYDAKNFGENYGAFLIHCGLTAMGNPGEKDTHPQHGELPLARYNLAWIEISDDESPVTLCGTYQHFVPFEAKYLFTPKVKLHKEGKAAVVEGQLKNLQKTALPYMYLNHINFSMHDVQNLQYDISEISRETTVVLDEVIPGIKADPRKFLEVSSDVVYDPELVAIIRNDKSRNNGVIVNKAVKKTDSFFWNAIRVAELDHTVVWLTQTPDRSACGFSLPATAGPRGLAEEAAEGNIKTLPAGDSLVFSFGFGFDDNDEIINAVIKMLGGKI